MRCDILQSWTAGKFIARPLKPARQKSTDRIYVYFNYETIGEFVRNEDVNKLVLARLKDAPVDLDEFEHYLVLR